MFSETIDGVQFEIVRGDIASQPDMEAVVNAANAQLRTGGGVAGAIHSAAGPKLAEEARPLAPLEPGQAVITNAHQLPNQKVIHSLGPRWGKDKPEAKLLKACYENALELADGNGIKTIAFPAISTGAFGYPLQEATEIALQATLDMASELDTVIKIRFLLYSSSDRETFEETFKKLTQ